jgi:hypothetical protein
LGRFSLLSKCPMVRRVPIESSGAIELALDHSSWTALEPLRAVVTQNMLPEHVDGSRFVLAHVEPVSPDLRRQQAIGRSAPEHAPEHVGGSRRTWSERRDLSRCRRSVPSHARRIAGVAGEDHASS